LRLDGLDRLAGALHRRAGGVLVPGVQGVDRLGELLDRLGAVPFVIVVGLVQKQLDLVQLLDLGREGRRLNLGLGGRRAGNS
jgi:hypothetical protein